MSIHGTTGEWAIVIGLEVNAQITARPNRRAHGI